VAALLTDSGRAAARGNALPTSAVARYGDVRMSGFVPDKPIWA
jgi:hypothetical protein